MMSNINSTDGILKLTLCTTPEFQPRDPNITTENERDIPLQRRSNITEEVLTASSKDITSDTKKENPDCEKDEVADKTLNDYHSTTENERDIPLQRRIKNDTTSDITVEVLSASSADITSDTKKENPDCEKDEVVDKTLNDYQSTTEIKRDIPLQQRIKNDTTSDITEEVLSASSTDITSDNKKENPDCEQDEVADQTLNDHRISNPEVETGWSWVILVTSFLIRIFSTGVFWSFGVFLIAWHDQISGSLTELQWLLSLLNGIPLASAPVVSALCKFYSFRHVSMVGSGIACIAFIAASFATNITHLYITFAIAGLGFGLTFQPTVVILAYHFDKRLARANGISFAGDGIGNFIFPPLLQHLIDQYGWNGALLIVSGLVANCAMFAALYRPSTLEIESRLDVTTQDNTSRQFKQERRKDQWIEKIANDRSGEETTSMQGTKSQNGCRQFCTVILSSFNFHLLTNLRFFLLFLANFPYGMSYVIVLQYLPARAVHGGIADIRAAFLVSIIGLTSVLTRLTHGILIDYHILTATMLTAIAFLISAVSCALFPISNQYAVLAALSTMIGLSSGVYNATVMVVAKEYVGVENISGAVGLMLVTTGAGIFLGLYLTGFMFDATGSYDLAFYLAGAGFLISSLLLFADPLVKCLQQRHEPST